MKTTNLFIELLVIGVGAVLCIMSMLYIIYGEALMNINIENTAFLIFPATAVTYVLGIIFDRLFDILTEHFDKKIRIKFFDQQGYDETRILLYDKSDAVKQVFDYTKSRIRIMRSWMFYWFVFAFCASVMYFKEFDSRFLIASLMLLCIALLSCTSWNKLTHTFNGMLSKAHKMMLESTSQE